MYTHGMEQARVLLRAAGTSAADPAQDGDGRCTFPHTCRPSWWRVLVCAAGVVYLGGGCPNCFYQLMRLTNQESSECLLNLIISKMCSGSKNLNTLASIPFKFTLSHWQTSPQYVTLPHLSSCNNSKWCFKLVVYKVKIRIFHHWRLRTQSQSSVYASPPHNCH